MSVQLINCKRCQSRYNRSKDDDDNAITEITVESCHVCHNFHRGDFNKPGVLISDEQRALRREVIAESKLKAKYKANTIEGVYWK